MTIEKVASIIVPLAIFTTIGWYIVDRNTPSPSVVKSNADIERIKSLADRANAGFDRNNRQK